MWKTIKYTFSMFQTDKTRVFDQAEHVQGPIYIMNKGFGSVSREGKY